jgi:hypothetical protein
MKDQIDATLRAALDAPEQLPALETWAASARSEAARAQYGYIILKKHFARVGAEIKHDEMPASWFSFVWLFDVNLDELLLQGSHSAMLKELLAEVVRLTQAFSGGYFTDNLYELLKRTIESQKLCALLEPLLPPEARTRMDELKEMLWRDRDDDRRRADEGYY